MKGLTICCMVCIFLFATVQGSYALTVKISSDNAEITEVGETVDIDVMIENAADVGSFQFDLSYDPEILMINDRQGIEIGCFLKGTVSQLPTMIDNNIGKLTVGAISFGQTKGASGRGLLATIRFTVKKTEDTLLKINSIKITNTRGRSISANREHKIRIIGYSADTLEYLYEDSI